MPSSLNQTACHQIKSSKSLRLLEKGAESSEYKEVAQLLDANFFIAHPYSSSGRGQNENTNRIICQYLPKKTGFEDIKKELIRIIQDKLNNRPIKYL